MALFSKQEKENIEFFLVITVSLIISGVIESLTNIEDLRWFFWIPLKLLITIVSFLVVGSIYYKIIKKKE